MATSDFLKRFALDPRRFWSENYSVDVSEPQMRLAEVAREAGATVVENASLADLAQAMRGENCVVLVSHWKGPEVLVEDLLESDWRTFVSRLEREGDVELAWLAKELSRRRPQSRGALRAILRDFVTHGHEQDGGIRRFYSNIVQMSLNVLNGKERDRSRRFQRGHPSPGVQFDDDFEVKARPFTLQSLRRERLDDVFEGLMLPGNRVEFADGLYSKESIAAVVPPEFSGELDLTTCTSTVLSDHLSRLSRGRYRTLQFDKQQDPGVACLVLERVFALMRENHPYPQARKLALRDLADYFSNSGDARLSDLVQQR